jgi:hypothetical protein
MPERAWPCSVPSIALTLVPLTSCRHLTTALCRVLWHNPQCFDVLLGALGVGFVLSLASAVPIFVVCQVGALGPWLAHSRLSHLRALRVSCVLPS